MSCAAIPPALSPEDRIEPRDLLVEFIDDLIDASAPHGPQGIDYARMVDSARREIGPVPTLPPGILARQRFLDGVSLVLGVREVLGIEAEQAWLAVRYEGRPTAEVASALGLPAHDVRDLCLRWEYEMMAAIAATTSP